MPTYDYQCAKCEHQFEIFQSIKAEPGASCPICQGPGQRLLGTGGAIIFKGSGFYITDYRSKSYTEKAKQESSATSSGGEPGIASKSEPKTEVTTPTKTATPSGGST